MGRIKSINRLAELRAQACNAIYYIMGFTLLVYFSKHNPFRLSDIVFGVGLLSSCVIYLIWVERKYDQKRTQAAVLGLMSL